MPKATSSVYIVPFRRRREGKTYYKKRTALLKSRKPRFVVRKQNRGLVIQVLKYSKEGDLVVVGAHSSVLKQFGWLPKRNIPTAYLLGLYIGKLAKEKHVEEVILDIGLHTPTKGSLVFYALKGAIDAGLSTKLNMKLDESRLKGEHISKYSEMKPERFTHYDKSNVDPKQLATLFEEVKSKIIG